MKKYLFQLLLILFATNISAQEWSKELEKRAKAGEVEALVEVGNAYFKGNGVKRDLEKAAKWYYEAIQRGNEEVKENFYSFYSKQLEKYAKSGDAQAQYEVGCAYQKGDGVDRNIKTAAEWYMMAADQGHEQATDKFYSFYSKELEKRAKSGQAKAQYELGNCYYQAKEIDRDAEEAAEWYKKAMVQGNEDAKEKFYSFYSKMLEKTAKDGDARAQYETGNAYLSGNGVKKDNETASEWYLKAMAAGHEGAKEKFYTFYSKQLEKRAKNGDAEAQYQTGKCYLLGGQVERDIEEAAEWLQKSMLQGHEAAKEKFYSFYSKQLEKRAKNGDAEAQFQTGKFYHKGAYVNRDIETAAEWYLEAKKQGHEAAKEQFYSFYSKVLEKDAKDNAESMYVLGCFYMDGNQVEKNLKKGTKYLATAYQKGHEQSFEKLSSTYNKDLEKIAKKGDKRAQIALAKCYLDGIGVDKNKKKVSKLLVKLKEDSVYGEEAKSLLERL